MLLSAGVGIAGPVAAVAGLGVVQMSPPDAHRGELLLLIGGLCCASAAALATRKLYFVPVLLILTIGFAMATFSSAGRMPALLAATGSTTASAALIDWGPFPGWPRRRRRSVLLALLLLVGAQIVWVVSNRAELSLGLIALALVTVEAHHRWARQLDHGYEWVSTRFGCLARAPLRQVRVVQTFLRRTYGTCASAITPFSLSLALAGASISALWWPVLWKLNNGPANYYVLGINDYPLHVEVARRFSIIPLRIEAPHLLFHLETWLLRPVVGTLAAPVVVTALATALAVIAVGLILRSSSPGSHRLPKAWALSGTIIYFLSETPTLILLALGWMPPVSPFLTLHWWGNTTWLVALPFTLLTLYLLELRLTGDNQNEPPGPVLAVIVVLGALAKPSFTLVLVPALPLYAALARPTERRQALRTTVWVAVPGAAVIAWQTWFLGTSQSNSFKSGWTFDPIVPPAFGWDRLGVAFWFPLMIVLAAIAATRGAFVREPAVKLVLICSVFALSLMLTVRETGEKATHGNMAVPAQACAALLIVLALRGCLRAAWARSSDTSRRQLLRSPIAVAAVAMTVLFLLGGALSYLDATGTIAVPTDWQNAPPR